MPLPGQPFGCWGTTGLRAPPPQSVCFSRLEAPSGAPHSGRETASRQETGPSPSPLPRASVGEEMLHKRPVGRALDSAAWTHGGSPLPFSFHPADPWGVVGSRFTNVCVDGPFSEESAQRLDLGARQLRNLTWLHIQSLLSDSPTPKALSTLGVMGASQPVSHLMLD